MSTISVMCGVIVFVLVVHLVYNVCARKVKVPVGGSYILMGTCLVLLGGAVLLLYILLCGVCSEIKIMAGVGS